MDGRIIARPRRFCDTPNFTKQIKTDEQNYGPWSDVRIASSVTDLFAFYFVFINALCTYHVYIVSL